MKTDIDDGFDVNLVFELDQECNENLLYYGKY